MCLSAAVATIFVDGTNVGSINVARVNTGGSNGPEGFDVAQVSIRAYVCMHCSIEDQADHLKMLVQ
jgi:hypothetical protein